MFQCGYADGFNVGVKNDTFKFIDKVRILKDSLVSFLKKDRIYVVINGKRCTVLGKVGMNHVAIQVTDGDVSIGDTVYLEVSPILVNSKIRREYI